MTSILSPSMCSVEIPFCKARMIPCCSAVASVTKTGAEPRLYAHAVRSWPLESRMMTPAAAEFCLTEPSKFSLWDGAGGGFHRIWIVAGEAWED